MLLETVPEKEDLEVVAVRSVRRVHECRMAGPFGGIVTTVSVLQRLLPDNARWIVPVVAVATAPLFFAPLIFLWRSPPQSVLQAHARALAARRAANKPIRLYSRASLLLWALRGAAAVYVFFVLRPALLAP